MKGKNRTLIGNAWRSSIHLNPVSKLLPFSATWNLPNCQLGILKFLIKNSLLEEKFHQQRTWKECLASSSWLCVFSTRLSQKYLAQLWCENISSQEYFAMAIGCAADTAAAAVGDDVSDVLLSVGNTVDIY